MGFDAHWLSLREPADVKARVRHILSLVAEKLDNHPSPAVLDIGCGTGSTYRSLAPFLKKETRWTLLDNDQVLLDEVAARHGEKVGRVRKDLNALDELPLADISLVTASALFDLCSEDFIRRFCIHLSDRRIGLYAALNYDGRTEWSDPHTLDATMIAAFNAHQRSDKGFGLSLGPEAWRFLAGTLNALDYGIHTAESPWILSAKERALHLALLQGIATAVSEYGLVDEDEVAAWYGFRHRSALAGRGTCFIGHQDIVAFPR